VIFVSGGWVVKGVTTGRGTPLFVPLAPPQSTAPDEATHPSPEVQTCVPAPTSLPPHHEDAGEDEATKGEPGAHRPKGSAPKVHDAIIPSGACVVDRCRPAWMWVWVRERAALPRLVSKASTCQLASNGSYKLLLVPIEVAHKHS
jgi:hypothetical protein